jgi:hypothetical protein
MRALQIHTLPTNKQSAEWFGNYIGFQPVSLEDWILHKSDFDKILQKMKIKTGLDFH